MGTIEDVTAGISALIQEAAGLQAGGFDKSEFARFVMRYESWYTRALVVVARLVPERLDDFKGAYQKGDRGAVSLLNYTIGDYLRGLTAHRDGVPEFDPDQAYQMLLIRQVGIVGAALEAASQALPDIAGRIRDDFLARELEASRALAQAGRLAAAGAVCGVALASFLEGRAARLGLNPEARAPLELNDALHQRGAYDRDWRHFIRRLLVLAEKCLDSSGNEPDWDEVKDLVLGVEKVIGESGRGQL
ncbi:MAG: hypothetical protein V1816_26155 [Pseudomonadota bacterium]